MEPLSQPNAQAGRTAEALISAIRSHIGASCSNCGGELCGHQVLMNFALGFRDAPRCLNCLASALSNSVGDLRDALIAYLNGRECYQTAWEWTSEHEGTEGLAPCPLAFGAGTQARCASVHPDNREPATDFSPVPLPTAAEALWDAGEMGCGDLVLELRSRLQSMVPGQVLQLNARDPGAREDLPAWCRLTGHTLVRAEPPTFWIKRKD
jgi:tRNA 2-thiouridine synthesizing protein A